MLLYSTKTQLLGKFYLKFLFFLFIFLFTFYPAKSNSFDHTETTDGINDLRSEIGGLKEALKEQNKLLPEITEKLNALNNNELLISEMWRTLNEIKEKNNEAAETLSKMYSDIDLVKQSLTNISLNTNTIRQTLFFKDAFIFNKEGKPVLFVDDIGYWLYKYKTNELVGWINPDTSVVYRNEDAKPIGFIEFGYLLDKRGYPVGILERSEYYRKEREKTSQALHRPIPPNFILREQAPRELFAFSRPASTWSIDSIEDLFFNFTASGTSSAEGTCISCK